MAAERPMKSPVFILAVSVSLTTVSVASAESGSLQPAAAQTKSVEMKDAATANVPGLITSEQHDAIPYRACINARGWVNERLVCSN
jgi:hypothetical protein